MQLVVNAETESLDALGIPQLIAKLSNLLDSSDITTSVNAQRFLLALSARKNPDIRENIVKYVISPKATTDKHAQNITEIVSVDPTILKTIDPATSTRIAALLLNGAKSVGVSVPYTELRNPAHALGCMANELDEKFILSKYNDFTNWVIEQAPTSPQFINSISKTPAIFKKIISRYQEKAQSSQFANSNNIASALLSMDETIGKLASEEEAFHLILSVSKGAKWGAYTPIEICNAKFKTLPTLRIKAQSFIASNSAKAEEIIGANINEFSKKYLEDKIT